MAFLGRISIVIVIMVMVGCQPEISPSPTVETEVCKNLFVAETEGYEDRLVFRFIPIDPEPDDYRVSYTIKKDQNTVVDIYPSVFKLRNPTHFDKELKH